MIKFTEEELLEAKRAIIKMIERSASAQTKLNEGTSQHTLQINRIKALKVAYSLLLEQLNDDSPCLYGSTELKNAIAPLNSLKSKSEKSETNLSEETWQHQMLERNIKAIEIVLPLIEIKLEEIL